MARLRAVAVMLSLLMPAVELQAKSGQEAVNSWRYSDENVEAFVHSAILSATGTTLRWSGPMNLTLSGDNTYSFRPIFDAYLSQFRPLVPFEISTDWDRTANFVVVISSEPSRDIAGVYYELGNHSSAMRN
jgi:hypothetical protein